MPPERGRERVGDAGEAAARGGVGLEHDHGLVRCLCDRGGVQELVEHASTRVGTVVCEEVDEFILVVVRGATSTIDGETIVGGVTEVNV